MAEKKSPPQKTAAPQRSGEKQAAPRASSGGRPSPRRTDVIRCERCGEDYSITYKKCPFCDERPGRTGISGRRVAPDGESYGGRVNPVQVIGLVISLAVIIAAAFIVFRHVAPLIFHDNSDASSLAGTSQSAASGSGAAQSGGGQSSADQSSAGTGSQGGDISQATPVGPVIASVSLSKSDVTLRADELFQLKATVTPGDTGAAVIWSSDDTSAATVDEYGNVTNVNAGSSQRIANITASCGDKSASCIVRCNPGSSASAPNTGTAASPAPESQQPTTPPSQPSPGTVTANSRGTIVNAENGLNIRSGPGTTYDVVASAANGATVVILEGSDGWYKIDYGGGTGYVSSDYVKVG